MTTHSDSLSPLPRERPLKTFHVYKIFQGNKIFWMNARGVSPAQVRAAVAWRNREKIQILDIVVEPAS